MELCDLWADESQPPSKKRRLQMKEEEWVPEQCPLPVNPRRRPIAYANPSARRAADVPHGGCSYNPEPTVHEAAVELAVTELERKERDQAKDDKRLHVRSRDRKIHSWMELKDDSEQEEDDPDPAVRPSKKKMKRKTQADRNRVKRNRVRVADMNRALAAKAFTKELDKATEYAATAAESKEKSQEATDKRYIIKKTVGKFKIRRLGGARFKPPALAVLPSSDVKRNLRTQQMRTSGVDALQDEFNSLKGRNLVSPRAPRHSARKYPLKYYVKHMRR